MDIYEAEGDRRQYMDLLLLADESPVMIEKYIDRGRLFVASDEGRGVVEIKSLAVVPAYQRHGLGRALIRHAEEACAGEGFHTLQVGTGDSELTVPFYERCGVVRSHVVENFFTDNYDAPIYEAGVQLVDMVYLRKKI